jgi:hypothetical protein
MEQERIEGTNDGKELERSNARIQACKREFFKIEQRKQNESHSDDF